jgi:hypothetical protein
MSEELIQLLKDNPNCRVTISLSRPRRKAQEGDVKIIRGKRFVRQQQMSNGGYGVSARYYVVRNGRPQYEWVPEDKARSDYRTGWIQPVRRKAKT